MAGVTVMRKHTRSYNRRRNKSRKKRDKEASLQALRTIDRVYLLRIFFILIGAFIIIRLFTIQVIQHDHYTALAFNSHKLFEEIYPERGDILVHDKYSDNQLYTIATNKNLSEVHAEPVHIKDPAATAQALAPLLNIPKEDLLKQIDKPGDPDEILKRRVPEEVVAAIQELKLSGIKFREEQWRYYPESESTAHITGYFGYRDSSRTGQYGLEGYFNEELSGSAGFIDGEKDALGRFLTMGESSIESAIDGTDLALTIDKNVQFYACDKLKIGVEEFAAKSGTVIIMQPNTGAIIAMCNYPSYDPNKYNEVESIEVFQNSAVSKTYEPGSVFKAFTMAAALDRGLVNANTTYVDSGEVRIAGYSLRNSDLKAYGTQTMTQVLEKSLNTGTIYAAQLLGSEAFYQYVDTFGFGKPTNIELAGETSGNISSVAKLKDIYTATGSYGQGLTATPIQLISAYAAIANGGKLMKPYIVEKQILPTGEEVITEPTVVRQVIQPNTSRLLSAMLVSVVDNGHANTASVPGYFMAGKTGTAQVATPNGYDAHRHNDTFIGFGPTTNSEFVMLVFFEEPANKPWADATAAPVWGKIASYLVQYYQIPPDRESE